MSRRDVCTGNSEVREINMEIIIRARELNWGTLWMNRSQRTKGRSLRSPTVWEVAGIVVNLAATEILLLGFKNTNSSGPISNS